MDRSADAAYRHTSSTINQNRMSCVLLDFSSYGSLLVLSYILYFSGSHFVPLFLLSFIHPSLPFCLLTFFHSYFLDYVFFSSMTFPIFAPFPGPPLWSSGQSF
jgi:hypothetical protein